MRKYLAIFLLPIARREHASLPERIREISNGDCKQVFAFGRKEGNAVGFLFTSRTSPHHIDFSTILLNGDQSLIVEIGDAFHQIGLGIARAWLMDHQAEKWN